MEYIIAIVVYFLFAMLTAYFGAYILVKDDKNYQITGYDSLAIIFVSMLWIIFIPLIVMIELGKERGKRNKEKRDDNEQ